MTMLEATKIPELGVEALQIALDTIFRSEKLFRKVSVYQLLWGKEKKSSVQDYQIFLCPNLVAQVYFVFI